MNDTDKRAFLAEKARIRKLHVSNLEENALTVTATSVSHTPRSATAMPIDTLFKAEVQVKNLSSKAMMCAVSVQDHQNVAYGNYILTFERCNT